MRKVRILKEASQEAIEAAAWYERKQAGLGVEFFAAIDAALEALEENLIPLSSLSLEAAESGAKRLILKRFPYDIVALELPQETIVIAIAHHSREPGYWHSRN